MHIINIIIIIIIINNIFTNGLSEPVSLSEI